MRISWKLKSTRYILLAIVKANAGVKIKSNDSAHWMQALSVTPRLQKIVLYLEHIMLCIDAMHNVGFSADA